MTKEFKVYSNKNETRYVLETMTAGATGSANVATAPQDTKLVQSRNMEAADKVPQKPRQGHLRQQTGGGKHRDKKKEQKQGQEKHRKPFMEDAANALKQKLIAHLKKANPELETNYLELASMDELRQMINDLPSKDMKEGHTDHEISMSRSELYTIAKQAMELFKLLSNRSEMEGLEAWQQSKITKAADYLNAVSRSLNYDEMYGDDDKFGVAEQGGVRYHQVYGDPGENTKDEIYLVKKHYFKVPFDKKDSAKQIGLRWDPDVKTWYLPEYSVAGKRFESRLMAAKSVFGDEIKVASEEGAAEGFDNNTTGPATWNGHRVVANRRTPKGDFLILQNKNDGKYEIHKQNPSVVGGLEFVSVHTTPDEMQSAFKKLTGIDESKQGVAEGSDISDQIEITLKVNKDSTVDVKAMLDGEEVGHVNFDDSEGELIPQDLYVDPEYRGQGIAAAMYNYTKSKGYTILRGEEQTDDAIGLWNKHRPGKDVWEQGVAEDFTDDVDNIYAMHPQPEKSEQEVFLITDMTEDEFSDRWTDLPDPYQQEFGYDLPLWDADDLGSYPKITVKPITFDQYVQLVGNYIKSEELAGSAMSKMKRGVAEGYFDENVFIDKIVTKIEKEIYDKKLKGEDALYYLRVQLLDQALKWVGRHLRKNYEPYLEYVKNEKDAKEFLTVAFRDAQNKGMAEGKIKGVDGKACWKGKRYAGKVKKADGTYKDKCVPVGEEETNESGLLAWAGRRKHGADYMKKASAAARKGASQEELGRLKDRYSKAEKVKEAEKKGLYYYVNKRKKAGTSRPASHPDAPSPQDWKNAAKTAKTEDVYINQLYATLNEEMQSQQQSKLMHAAANDPAVAKKTGVSQKVAREFVKASHGQKVSKLPKRVKKDK